MSVGTVLAWAGGVLAAFLVGSLNPATMIARLLGKDLASSGSGNPGATNAGRVLGRKWGVVVGVLDVLKGLVPTLVAGHLFGAHAAYAVGIAAVLGHIWSPFLKGRGGKGVATTLGAILGVHPWFALVVVVVFAVAVLLTRWVAAGSIFGALAHASSSRRSCGRVTPPATCGPACGSWRSGCSCSPATGTTSSAGGVSDTCPE